MKLTINKIFIILMVLSFLGFVDSSFLTITDYKHIIPPCTITHGCEKVLSSSFATIYGVPLAFFGVLYFAASMLLNVSMLHRSHHPVLRKLFILFNSSGVIAAIILLTIQFLIIKALCQYCMLVELLLFLIFYFSILFLKRSKINLAHL